MEILMDYSNRWVIENGIKDLVGSYYMDKCPGTRPHLADVHFLCVTICRMIYKMISDDLGDWGLNRDGTVKTMGRMRNKLFRQGPGVIFFKEGIFEIKFRNAFSIPMTKMLDTIFRKIDCEFSAGLNILNGCKLRFTMRVPHGEEHRNSLEKKPLSLSEKN